MKKVNDNIGHEAHLGGAIAGFFSTIFISPMQLSFTNLFTVLILLIPIVYFYIKSK